MGIDVNIYVHTTDGEPPRTQEWLQPEKRFRARPVDECGPGWFEFDIGGPRHYSPSYARGPWPEICARLLEVAKSRGMADGEK